jgi:ribonuclease D
MDINNISYIFADTDQKLYECLNYLSSGKVLGVDTETTGLDPNIDKIRLLQVAVSDNPVAVIDVQQVSEEALSKLRQLFHSNSIKVFQNAKFDLKFLMANGFKISGPIFDTMLAAQVLRDNNGPRSYGLEALADFYLNIRLPKEEQKSNWSSALTKQQIEYSATRRISSSGRE